MSDTGTPGVQHHSHEPRVESVSVALARLESKLDIIVARHEARIEEHGRSIQRLEESIGLAHAGLTTNALALAELREHTKSTAAELRDAEGRLSRQIEANKPGPVWPALAACVAALALILTLAEQLYANAT